MWNNFHHFISVVVCVRVQVLLTLVFYSTFTYYNGILVLNQNYVFSEK